MQVTELRVCASVYLVGRLEVVFTAEAITRFHSARKGSERNSWSQERLVLALVLVLGLVYHLALAVVLEVVQVLYLPAVLCLEII